MTVTFGALRSRTDRVDCSSRPPAVLDGAAQSNRDSPPLLPRSPEWTGNSAGNRIRNLSGEQRSSRRGRTRLAALAAENARIDLLVDGVTGTGGALEPPYIENRDVAPPITDQLPAL